MYFFILDFLLVNRCQKAELYLYQGREGANPYISLVPDQKRSLCPQEHALCSTEASVGPPTGGHHLVFVVPPLQNGHAPKPVMAL